MKAQHVRLMRRRQSRGSTFRVLYIDGDAARIICSPGNTMNSLRVIPYTCHRDIMEGGQKSLSRISRLNWRHCCHCSSRRAN